MSAVVPRLPRGRPARRLPATVVREVEAAQHRGVAAAARVNAAAYVTHTALNFTAGLTGEEARLIEQCPLGEGRYKAIVDHFTGVACAEIAGMGW
jgi:hypothetical protein